MEGDLRASRFFVATTLMYIITLDSLYAVLSSLIHAYRYYILLSPILNIILNKTLDNHGVLQLGSLYCLVHVRELP